MQAGDVPWSADITALGDALRTGALGDAVGERGVDIE
jgi:hypothetical protein